MRNEKIIIPYSVGTYLDRIKDGKRHVDKVDKYIINEHGIFVVLMLDARENYRALKKISIEEFNNEYVLTKDVHLNISEENVKAAVKCLNRVKRKVK